MHAFLYSIAAIAVLGTPACSLIVDTTDSQCQTDGDCAKFAGTRCVAGGCEPVVLPDDGSDDQGPIDECSSNQECLVEGDRICVDQRCVPIAKQDCGEGLGDYKVDNAWLIGALLPIDGPHERYSTTLRNTLALASRDFSDQDLPPLPDETPSRAIGVVVCNETTNVERAVSHLVDTLHVKALIGPILPGPALEILPRLAENGGPFALTPTVTAAVSNLPSGAAVRRACPTDDREVIAIAAVTRELIANGVAGEAPGTAILYRDDAYGAGASARVAGALDGDTAIRFGYGDPDTLSVSAAEAAYDEAAAAVTDRENLPQLLLILGQTQAATHIIPKIEQAWPPDAEFRPFYVVAHGLQVPELLAVVAEDPALADRLVGTAPGGHVPDDFVSRYNQSADDGDPLLYGASQTFDAFYQLVYGFAAVGTASFSAEELAQAVDRNSDVDAETVAVGPDGIARAYELLSGGDSVDLAGISGSLDPAAGEGVRSPVRVWCVSAGAGNPIFAASGFELPERGTTLDGDGTGRCPLR